MELAADRGPMLIVKIKQISNNIQIFALADNTNDKTRVLGYAADKFTTKPISLITTVLKTTVLPMNKSISEIEMQLAFIVCFVLLYE